MHQQIWVDFGLSKAEILILCITHAIIDTVGFFSNLLLNVAVIRSRWTREPCTTMLLLNLSVTNFLFSAVYQPIHIWFLSTDTPLHTVADIHVGTAYGLRLATTCGCTLIACDRFIYVCFPLRYVTRVTEKRVKLAIACAWFLSGLFVLILFRTGIFAYHFVGVNIAIVLILYIKIYLTARKQRQRIAVQYPHTEKKRGRIFKDRGTLTTAVILGMSMASWLPILIINVRSGNTSRALAWILLLPSLITCLEPYIYYRRIVTFRSAINRLLGLYSTRGMALRAARTCQIQQSTKRPENDGQV